MTLFEAIRELKEGQAIEGISPIRTSYASPDGGCISRYYTPRHVEWKHGEDKPRLIDNTMDLNTLVRIIDLPKPQMSLEEGLDKAREKAIITGGPKDITWGEAVAKILRSLPIDWQAEVDRKEGE